MFHVERGVPSTSINAHPVPAHCAFDFAQAPGYFNFRWVLQRCLSVVGERSRTKVEGTHIKSLVKIFTTRFVLAFR